MLLGNRWTNGRFIGLQYAPAVGEGSMKKPEFKPISLTRDLTVRTPDEDWKAIISELNAAIDRSFSMLRNLRLLRGGRIQFSDNPIADITMEEVAFERHKLCEIVHKIGLQLGFHPTLQYVERLRCSLMSLPLERRRYIRTVASEYVRTAHRLAVSRDASSTPAGADKRNIARALTMLGTLEILQFIPNHVVMLSTSRFHNLMPF